MATVRSSDGQVLDDGRATEDALFGGRVVLLQPRRGEGYRTNVDALLLAWFAARLATRPAPSTPARPARVAYDLGAGVGAIGLALLQLQAARRVVFVELDGAAAALARANLDANGWAERGEVVTAGVDAVATLRRGEADLVVCNPPYVAPGRGRAAASETLARIGDVGPFVRAARQIAGRKARVCFTYPAADLVALVTRLAAEGLHPKRLRLVHGTAAAPARIALVEAQPGRPGGLRALPPLVEREGGRYVAEMRALLGLDGEPAPYITPPRPAGDRARSHTPRAR